MRDRMAPGTVREQWAAPFRASPEEILQRRCRKGPPDRETGPPDVAGLGFLRRRRKPEPEGRKSGRVGAVTAARGARDAPNTTELRRFVRAPLPQFASTRAGQPRAAAV